MWVNMWVKLYRQEIKMALMNALKCQGLVRNMGAKKYESAGLLFYAA